MKDLPEISMFELFKNIRFTNGFLGQTFAWCCMTFISPLLSVHLEELGVDDFIIGLYWCVPSVAMILFVPIIPCIVKSMSRRGMCFLAYIILFISINLVGATPWSGVSDSPQTILIGMFLFGAAMPFIIIPLMPEMMQAISEQYGDRVTQKTMVMISGIFNSGLGIG
jgi:hypothetical protein